VSKEKEPPPEKKSPKEKDDAPEKKDGVARARPSLRLLALADVTFEAGQDRSIEIQVERTDCPGEIALEVAGLPAGVAVEPASIPADADKAVLRFRAGPDAVPGKRRVRVSARAGDATADSGFDVTVVGEVANTLGMKLKLVPRGTFRMGSPETDRDAVGGEKPQHEVEITRPFYMGMHTVTVGQFRAFVEDTRFKGKKYVTEPERDGQGGGGYNAEKKEFDGRNPKYNWKNTGWAQTDDHPVVNVTWNDAVAFCEWLSEKEGRTYELPTEAEWEYACRAGTKTRYYFGDDAGELGEYGWYRENADRGTHPVGTKKPNDWGLFDMHGNVWQWCADGKRAYPQEASKNPVKDPKNLFDSANRGLRGGSWLDDPRVCRAAYRHDDVPGSRNSYIGFRVVLRPGPRTP
jgi:formylglycine-generating enzyme required for sulfatase activity